MIAQQIPLPEIIDGLSTSHTALGGWGEMWLINMLQGQGFRVAANHKFRRGDLQVFLRDGTSIFVEVKTARQGKDGRWGFTLYKYSKHGMTDHRRTDFVAFLCITKAGAVIPFIVPTTEIANRRAFAIRSNPRNYAGKLAIYRQSIRKLHFHKGIIQ